MFIIEHAISGFHRSISEVFALLEYCAAPIGSNGRFGVLEDGNYRLSRNVDNLTSTLRNIPEKQRQHLTLFPNLGMHREEYFNAPRRVFRCTEKNISMHREEYFNQTYIFFCPHKDETCNAGCHKQSTLEFGRLLVRGFTGTPNVLTEDFHGVSQFVKANIGLISRTTHKQLFFLSFLINHSSIVVSLDTVFSQTITSLKVIQNSDETTQQM